MDLCFSKIFATIYRHRSSKCSTFSKAAFTGKIHCPQVTLISYRDQANQAEMELVKLVSAKTYAFLTYLEMEISREEDAKKGGKGIQSR